MSDYNLFVGGDVTNSSIAQGAGATAGSSIVGENRQRAALLLDDFIATLASYGDESSAVRDMRSLAESAKREVAADRPDKGRIESLLNGIRAILSTTSSAILRVAELANAIDSIRGAVGHL